MPNIKLNRPSHLLAGLIVLAPIFLWTAACVEVQNLSLMGVVPVFVLFLATMVLALFKFLLFPAEGWAEIVNSLARFKRDAGLSGLSSSILYHGLVLLGLLLNGHHLLGIFYLVFPLFLMPIEKEVNAIAY